MNRRGFLAGLLAAPAVAALPDVRRPGLRELLAECGIYLLIDADDAVLYWQEQYDERIGKFRTLCMKFTR